MEMDILVRCYNYEILNACVSNFFVDLVIGSYEAQRIFLLRYVR